MSRFVLQDHGGGRFSLSGRMTFDTAGQILRESEIPFEEHTRIEVDLSGVDETDSAGLALLLEWITWANHTVREIRFTDMPEKVNAIAKTCPSRLFIRKIFSSGSANVFMVEPANMLEFNYFALIRSLYWAPVGGEFLFKLPLADDTSHGSRNSIGNYSGEQRFDQCWPASGQVSSRRVLGEHGPDCNIL